MQCVTKQTTNRKLIRQFNRCTGFTYCLIFYFCEFIHDIYKLDQIVISAKSCVRSSHTCTMIIDSIKYRSNLFFSEGCPYSLCSHFLKDFSCFCFLLRFCNICFFSFFSCHFSIYFCKRVSNGNSMFRIVLCEFDVKIYIFFVTECFIS